MHKTSRNSFKNKSMTSRGQFNQAMTLGFSPKNIAHKSPFTKRRLLESTRLSDEPDAFSLETIEKQIVISKLYHLNYDPKLLTDSNRSSIVNMLRREQTLRISPTPHGNTNRVRISKSKKSSHHIHIPKTQDQEQEVVISSPIIYSPEELKALKQEQEIKVLSRTNYSKKKLYKQDFIHDGESLICPISKTTIENPAITRYGDIFEESAIKDYVKKMGTCPIQQLPLRLDQIYHSDSIKSYIVKIVKMKQLAKRHKEQKLINEERKVL